MYDIMYYAIKLLYLSRWVYSSCCVCTVMSCNIEYCKCYHTHSDVPIHIFCIDICIYLSLCTKIYNSLQLYRDIHNMCTYNTYMHVHGMMTISVNNIRFWYMSIWIRRMALEAHTCPFAHFKAPKHGTYLSLYIYHH